MNHHLSLTLGTTLISTILHGQDITKEEILKFNIKSITVTADDSICKAETIYFYNDQGDIENIDDKDCLTGITRKNFAYDSQRLLREEKTFRLDGRIQQVDKYFYDSKNHLIKKESIDSIGRIDVYWTYEYDDIGNKIKETQKSLTKENRVTRYKYANGKLTEEETSNDLVEMIDLMTYKYNNEGKLIESQAKDHFNRITTSVYTYNEAGKLLKLEQKLSDDVSVVITYKYGDRGLLENCFWRSSLERTPYKTIYKVTY